MAILAEERAYCPKVRLFLWNEKLVDKNKLLKDSQGLCLFDITTTNASKIPSDPDEDEDEDANDSGSEIQESQNRWFNKVLHFDPHRLLSAQENLPLVTRLVTQTAFFSPEINAELGKQISDHLFRNFELSTNNYKNCNYFSSTRPRLVMVVQIRVWRLFDYTGIDQNSSSPVDNSSFIINHLCSHDEDKRDDNDDYDNCNECIEEWDLEEVRWYDYSHEAVAYWLHLRNYLGEPKHDNLLTKALTKDVPRGLMEIPPCSIVVHDKGERRDEASCSICFNGFAIHKLDEIERTICSHVFHKRCIWKWLSKMNSCPNCRHPGPLLASNFISLGVRSSYT